MLQFNREKNKKFCQENCLLRKLRFRLINQQKSKEPMAKIATWLHGYQNHSTIPTILTILISLVKSYLYLRNFAKFLVQQLNHPFLDNFQELQLKFGQLQNLWR